MERPRPRRIPTQAVRIVVAMGERTFERADQTADERRSRRRAIGRSIELAERLLDEVTSARQDWAAVAAAARELALLAGRLSDPESAR
jgi:hypothetical protein